MKLKTLRLDSELIGDISSLSKQSKLSETDIIRMGIKAGLPMVRKCLTDLSDASKSKTQGKQS